MNLARLNVSTRQLVRTSRDYVKSNQELRKIVGNSAWLFSDRVLRLVASLVVSVWIARYLGPNQYGMLNFAIAFVALFAPIATLGSDNVVVRELVKEPDKQAEILGTAAGLITASSILVALAAIGAVMIVQPGDSTALALVTIIAISNLFLPANAADFWFQSKVQSKLSVLARNSAFFITAGLRLLLIFAGASVIAFAWAMAAESLLAALGLIFFYVRQQGGLGRWRFGTIRARRLLKDSWPLILSGLSVLLFMRSDQVMLAQLADFQEVGLYAAAVRFVEVLMFLPSVVLISIYPRHGGTS